MAAAKSTLPNDDRPDIRPDLRSREAINTSTTGGGSRGATSGTRGSAGGAGSSTGTSGGGHTATPSPPGGLYNDTETGDTSSNLRGAEESPSDNEGEDSGWYAPDNSSSTGRGRVRFRMTKRKAAVGLSASFIISAIVGITSISSGPLEFIHIAQLLDRFHFASQQDAEDGRLMKIARYINDTHKPQNTRLGFVGNAVATKLDTKIKDATGLTSDFNTTSGRFKGYVGDRSSEQFKGKTSEEIRTQLASTYKIDASSITVTDSEVSFNPDSGSLNPLKGYFSQTNTARTLLGEAGLSKISAYVGSRVLTQRAGWTFHPIKKLDSAIQAKALEGGKKAVDKLKEQFQSDDSNYVEGTIEKPGGAATGEPGPDDSSGKPTPPAPTSQERADATNGIKADTQNTDPNDPQSIADTTSSLKAKILGGGAGAIGAICVLSSINKSIPQLRQAKVIAPMMKMAGEAISVGSQAQSGQDISALQLGFYKDKLDAKNADGTVTSTWNQAESVQAELGGPLNPKNDIPQEGQVFNGSSSPFGFLSNPVIDTVCSVAGGIFGTIFNIVTGPVNFVVSTIASDTVLGPAASYLANWLSGAPINPLASGSDYGNYINYGARDAADQQYASAGGVPLSSSDEQQLAVVDNTFDKADFQSHSLAYRIFNTTDNHTLAAHIIDDGGGAGPVDSVATMVRNFGNVFGDALKTPASLFTGVTHAATPPYDWHGLKKVGFTTSELADKKYENPFDNACYVAGNCQLADGTSVSKGILDGPNGKTYSDRAKSCFNITISGDSSSGWTTDNNTEAVDFQDATYTSASCQDPNPDWLRVRFWLLDTPTIEGYDCSQSDTPSSDQSCNDVGFQSDSSSGSTPTPSGGSGTLPTGSSQDLAKQLLPYLGNQIKCNTSEGTKCSDIVNTANGTSIKGGEGCQVDALQPGLLGMLLELVKMGHTFVLSALCSDHHDDGLRGHAGGRAADFNYIDGVFMGPNDAPWDSAKIAVGEKLDQDIASFMPKSTGFGQIQCHPIFDFLQGFNTFDDACHHQHIQVET